MFSAPSCGEKQYSSDFIDIPFTVAAANPASDVSVLRRKRTQCKADRFDLTRKLYVRF